jgi:hypothetical protein
MQHLKLVKKNKQNIFREPSTKKHTFKGFNCLPWLQYMCDFVSFFQLIIFLNKTNVHRHSTKPHLNILFMVFFLSTSQHCHVWWYQMSHVVDASQLTLIHIIDVVELKRTNIRKKEMWLSYFHSCKSFNKACSRKCKHMKRNKNN